MSNIISKFSKSSIISSIVLCAFAILLIVQSEATIVTMSYILGGVLVAIGALAILKFVKNVNEMESSLDVVYGLSCVILGVLIITNPKAIASVIPFIIGIVIVVNSAIKLQYSLELRREENELWVSTFILAIIMTICGIVLIFNPFEGAVFLTRIVGVFILIYAVLDLISTFVIRNTFKKIHTAINESVVKEVEILEEKDAEEEEEPKKKKNKKKKDK